MYPQGRRNERRAERGGTPQAGDSDFDETLPFQPPREERSSPGKGGRSLGGREAMTFGGKGQFPIRWSGRHGTAHKDRGTINVSHRVNIGTPST
eukprot:5538866-Karenia_brevis.AAC.1